MIRDTLLALGLLLSTATQLRLSSAPLGPGEFCLASWVLLSLVYETRRSGPPITPALTTLSIFWLSFALAQSLGLLVGLAIEDFRDTGSARHDMLAYTLMAAITFFVVVMPDSSRRLRRVIWIAVSVGAICLALLVAGGFDLISIPALSLWLWGGRFIGWSQNPNQLALSCAVLVLLALHLAETATRPKERFVALACAAPCFLAGMLTKSDSFVLFVLVGAPLFIGLKIWTWLFSKQDRLTFRTTFAWLMVLAIPLLLVSAAPFGPSIGDKIQEYASTTMAQNNQAENRFKLWREAIDLGVGAGMLGLGPGPHLVSKQWKRPPPDKFEAHNTVLDLFVQGGILAVLSFVWLSATTCLVAFRARLMALTTLAVTLSAFSMFHLVARSPIVWFSIALCLAAGDGIRRINPGRNWNRQNV